MRVYIRLTYLERNKQKHTKKQQKHISTMYSLAFPVNPFCALPFPDTNVLAVLVHDLPGELVHNLLNESIYDDIGLVSHPGPHGTLTTLRGERH